ncbi:hotdog family protein [Cupriavidus gilardii]|uniref:hotdog family protein n=1 Tax=Cupriavidus gilardii TaxID=82541 RepID=UPI001ABDEA22|nr:hotdog family protein [Cupriavidus gilardii]MBO4123518.1 hotdog family protein [Cupriavidus gilardii]
MPPGMPPGTPVGRDWIAAHIPHRGAMCLLDEVVDWNAQRIRCEARNHASPDHPLRAEGRLAALCGIEYAAQAMAVHGALLRTGAAAAPRVGYLASVRKVEIHAERLDTVAGPLTIEAERIGGDERQVLYEFALRAGDAVLLTGRAAVVLDATPADCAVAGRA